MTTPPLPDTPSLRVRLTGVDNAGNDWGTRFYLSYAGSAPTGANCSTIASDIESAYATDLAGLANPGIILDEIDVIDIATTSGLSGQWTGSEAGTRTGTALPIQCAMGVEYGIARRYRGGKPRAYFPFGNEGDLLNAAMWGSTFVGDVNTNVAAFFTAVEAISVGAVGALRHVNLSYYEGFHNVTNSSGRTRAVPTYRASALHDNITGYFAKAEINSQKRRRTATTP